MRHEHPLAADVLNWLVRLPFLAAADLALLTGGAATDIEAVVAELERDGHVDSIVPSSPDLDTTRLYVLSEAARSRVGSGMDDEMTGVLPLPWREVVHRLGRLEATVALNVFLAGLVASLRSGGHAEVEDCWSLPARRPPGAWWPPYIDACCSLRSKEGRTPFFVLVDRASAPAAHRNAVVADWYRFRGDALRCGPLRVPPALILSPALILCPGPAEEALWSEMITASGERRGVAPLEVLLASRAALADTPDGPLWRRAGQTERTTLLSRLAPVSTSPAPVRALGKLDGLPPPTSKAGTRLHRWAQETANRERGASASERIAALALTSSSVEKRLLDCLGRHPLLSMSELALVLRVESRVARRAVARALAKGLIVHASDDQEPRYCLAATGLRMLAARDGVPVRRYVRHAPLTAMPERQGADRREKLPTLLQQREHTIGANSFFLRCLRGEVKGGPRLVSWRNAAESAIRFEGDGARRWLRPDGAGEVLLGGQRNSFLLEWGRGTERLPILAAKLARYSDFFRTHEVAKTDAPVLLLVTTTPQREELLWCLATAVAGLSSGHLMTTTASLLEYLGPFGAIWKHAKAHKRHSWITAEQHQ